MNVRSLMITAVAISAAATFQAPASAAAVLQLTPATSSFTASFNDTLNDTTVFNVASGSSLFLTISGSGTGSLASLAATFGGDNPAPLALNIIGNTFSGIFTPVAGNISRLVLTGSGVGAGAFTGTLTVLSAAVPEASTWAMMTIGFGALGYSLRRRRPRFSLA